MLCETVFGFSNRYDMSDILRLLYESLKVEKACLKNNICKS